MMLHPAPSEWPYSQVGATLGMVSGMSPKRGFPRVRVQSLTLVAASAALLAPTTLSASGVPPRQGHVAHSEGDVTAADLLARVRACTPVSRGRFRMDDGAPATVPICDTHEAVFWKADLDVDCDGRPTAHCNSRTDPFFTAATAFQPSDDHQLSAESLPYIVVPAPSVVWDHRAHGIRGGSVAAVIYRDRVQFAVVGDAGPRGLIGEASYATARGLHIRPDPRHGGAASGVTYIVFKNSRIRPIEDRRAAVTEGERLARLFLRPR